MEIFNPNHVVIMINIKSEFHLKSDTAYRLRELMYTTKDESYSTMIRKKADDLYNANFPHKMDVKGVLSPVNFSITLFKKICSTRTRRTDLRKITQTRHITTGIVVVYEYRGNPEHMAEFINIFEKSLNNLREKPGNVFSRVESINFLYAKEKQYT